MYEILIWAVPALAAAGMAITYLKTKDPFHPLLLTLPMFAFIYGWMPLRLKGSEALFNYLDVDQLEFVQSLNLAGMLAFIAGCLICSRRTYTVNTMSAALDNVRYRTLRSGALMLGTVGIAAWLKTIINRGGLRNAFGSAYGGGWDDSGYVRDAMYLTISALLLLFATLGQNKLSLMDRLFIAACSAPWIVQGLLGARRGPTFMITVIVAMSWYMARGSRPPLVLVSAAGALLGLFMLLLVVNRGQIYWGSDLDLRFDLNPMTSVADRGNEYIYGSGAVVNAQLTQRFYWGRRYVMHALVRMIPSSIWPTKYEDFGLQDILINGGTSGGELVYVMGWGGTPGAAPGMVADLWLEFSWLALPAIFITGILYGVCWSKAVSVGGIWTGLFVLISALSIHLVMQGVESVTVRFLEIFVPVLAVWWLAARRSLTEQAKTAAIWVPAANQYWREERRI
jgi:oligosaccharide repeat unit polymerase